MASLLEHGVVIPSALIASQQAGARVSKGVTVKEGKGKRATASCGIYPLCVESANQLRFHTSQPCKPAPS